jgi:hypothetical protein
MPSNPCSGRIHSGSAEHCLLEPDVGGLFAAEEAAPPEARVVERLQEVTALQDTGDDATS